MSPGNMEDGLKGKLREESEREPLWYYRHTVV